MKRMLVACVVSLVCGAVLPAEAHVFSLSCKVTALNGDFGTAEGRARTVDWCRRNGMTKLWLESYRHAERVPTERLVEVRDAFRKEGFSVSGLITPTQLNDSKSMVCCWTDPKARARLAEECVRAAVVEIPEVACHSTIEEVR